MGKMGEEISLYGRIIQIAHNYDDLVRGFETSNGMLPFEAIRIIHENSEGIYDHEILNIFLHRTSYFKLGEMVSFPSGVSGKIIGFHNYIKYPHLPIVQFINGSIIDLFYTKMSK
jgi:HD-GYP domain-containing protein (c-di-GMP phosphodiesterase class II)